MIGKQRARSGSFTMLHATALVLALMMAAWINPASTYSTNSIETASSVDTDRETAGVVMIFKATVFGVFECDDVDTGLDV